MSEVKKISELDRLKLENLKLKMDSLRPAVQQFQMLQMQAQNIVTVLATGLKVKPELLKIDVLTGVYEILPEPKPAQPSKKEKKKNAVQQ